MMRIAAGMLLLLVALGPMILDRLPVPVPGPGPEPAPVVSDTETWRAILTGMADFIEADGKVSKPVFRTMQDIVEYRDAVVSVPIRGIGGGQRVAELLGPKLGAITSPVLDAQTRTSVVSAFREAAKGL